MTVMTRPKDSEVRKVLRDLKEREGGKIVGRKLYPLQQLIPQQPLAPARDLHRRTYLLQAAPQQEARVMFDLRDAGLDGYCPQEPLLVRYGNRGHHRTVLQPMMRGYLFPMFDVSEEKQWKLIPNMRGVVRLFMYAERPLPIPEAAIDRIKQVEALLMNGGKRPKPRTPFEVGAWVQIDDMGPWNGFIGQVVELVVQRERVKVALDIFGRLVPVEVSISQLRAV